MSGESIKDGLEGLSKIEGFTDVLFNAIYWVAVIFVILFVVYIFFAVRCFVIRRKTGVRRSDEDDFLDD
ncbi:MAG: hypothetical protein Q4D54_06130 [Eubacteriales bacterium]|nr:hypothetical protein [Eubacteriales bacterium]